MNPSESPEHVRWLTEPAVHRATLVCAFTGWNDAGDAASQAAQTMIEQWQAAPVAEIDPEHFTDFATVRPHVRLDELRNRHIVWPTAGVWTASLPGSDVVIVLGPEPSLRWRLFSDQVIGIARRCGATSAITLGSLLADVPHTRATQLIATSNDTMLIERFSLETSSYEGPTGIVGVLQTALSAAGVPAASLWAAVPNYANSLPSPPAAIALLERACQILGVPRPATPLDAQISSYQSNVDDLVESNDLEQYVTRLEELIGDDEPVDPDSLVEEVERFLRDQE
jgi:hypothetical protein